LIFNKYFDCKFISRRKVDCFLENTILKGKHERGTGGLQLSKRIKCGSFVSTKKNPEDIDMCFDISGIPKDKIEKEFPLFFDVNQELFDLLSGDRDSNPKRLVKPALKDIIHHDQK
jgi:hypothetical protein